MSSSEQLSAGGLGGSVPDTWTDDCEQKKVRVDVAAYTDSGSLNYVEIPTSRVEARYGKGDRASIVRNARIDYPTEWDGESVRDVVKGFGNAEVTFGRVSYKNSLGNWIPTQLGYIAGVGPSSEIESKAWIYDFAKMLEHVPVQTSFLNPSIQEVVRAIGQLVVEETPIPLTDVVIAPPNFERVVERDIAPLVDDETEQDLQKQYQAVAALDGPAASRMLENASELSVETITPLDPDEIIETNDLLGTSIIAGALGAAPVPIPIPLTAARFVGNQFGIGVKKFSPNRHTLLDVCHWLRNRMDVHFQFVPSDGGVAMLFHSMPPRRNFIGDSVAEDMASDDRGFIIGEDVSALDTLEITRNNALYEINPANQVRIRGDTGRGFQGIGDSFGSLEDIQRTLTSTEYPEVVARADPLWRAAGGQELWTDVIESDAETVEAAKLDAVAALRDAVTQRTEGNIECLGHPHLQPFDTVDAYEQCEGLSRITQVPVRYEIQEVTHLQEMGGFFTSTLDVTVHLSNIQISFPTAEMVSTE